MIFVVHPAVVSCCVRVTSSDGESGIGQTVVCSNWRLTVSCPSICHPLPRWLWVYEAGEVHSGSNGVWTTWRICDHSHHRICTESHFLCHIQTTCLCLQQFPNSTLTNDSHISAMVTVTLPHTTPAALCQVGFSPTTVDVSTNRSTSLSKVSCNCPYK